MTCFRVICRNRRVHYKKCLSKGYEWFEARDYTNPGNLAGCMIHKTRYGVGGCYELECAEHYTQDSCEADNVRAGRGRAVAALSRAVATVSSPPNGPRRETTPEPRALPSSPEHDYTRGARVRVGSMNLVLPVEAASSMESTSSGPA